MVNTCCVTYCKTDHKQKEKVVEYLPIFRFPDPKQFFKEKWIRFVNRKHWTPTKNEDYAPSQDWI